MSLIFKPSKFALDGGTPIASKPPAYFATKSDKSTKDICYMQKGFVPGKNDVILGRSMKCFNHSGNRALRKMVADRLEEYSNAEKSEKSFIISEVMEAIREKTQNGDGFLKFDTSSSLWYTVCEYLGREKVSQTFRDALGNYRSSSQGKKQRRKMARANADSRDDSTHAKLQQCSLNFAASLNFANLVPPSTTEQQQRRRRQQQQQPPSPPPASPLVVSSYNGDGVNTSPQMLNDDGLFDTLAKVLPPNYGDDTNPFEPLHLPEKNMDLCEPAALFESSPYDRFAAFGENQVHGSAEQCPLPIDCPIRQFQPSTEQASSAPHDSDAIACPFDNMIHCT
ncbi:Nitrilase family, member 2 [Seminavis robusta]|uniref:Nitrilase family, member 2 n=1 Tax=Seminavis robusta TaxID=568900 RepID=A0A9N8HM93_9STRA|nr:Nitrilase family, member 2 [Seminavis robusta]|eukprot:Sro878_g214740.1 Nitrilase family, member 2 (338) ;mRNA; f:19840-20947